MSEIKSIYDIKDISEVKEIVKNVPVLDFTKQEARDWARAAEFALDYSGFTNAHYWQVEPNKFLTWERVDILDGPYRVCIRIYNGDQQARIYTFLSSPLFCINKHAQHYLTYVAELTYTVSQDPRYRTRT